MPTDKVKEFIKKLGAPKLTKAQVAIIKDHHEYHGDKKVKIIGAIAGRRRFCPVYQSSGTSGFRNRSFLL